MFRFALVKLTLLYLCVIMVISIFFSLNLYRISSQEIDTGLARQQTTFERIGQGRGFGPGPNPDLIFAREAQLEETKVRVIWQLVYTNIVILITGGGISYFLAKRTIKPIEESHEAQSRFAADASHELRSPLAAMKSEIEVALRDPNLRKEDLREILGSNLEELDKLADLSEELLQLSRNNGVTHEVVDVFDVVKTSIQRIEKKKIPKKINIENNISKRTRIIGDKENLTRLFVILLDNATKYSNEKSSILISLAEHHRLVHIAVTDQGPGINKADLPHIFERFYRADQSRSKNKVEGYGLGLSIAKKIVDLSHGKIEVVSVEGKGSTFTVKLPIVKS